MILSVDYIDKHLVPELEKPIRLSDYAVGIFISISSKSGVKKAIKKGIIKVDDKIATTALFIKGGETISLYQEAYTKQIAKFPLEVLYEDNYLAVINKPAGILVSGNKHKTIANALSYNLEKSSEPDSLITPLAVHRLDFPTSGLLLIAKTNSTLIKLSEMFERKQISKAYYAITIGQMQQQGKIITPIDKKYSETKFEVLETQSSPRFDILNLVKLIPATGRRHQLRKHLSEIGNPILGDKEYGKDGLILNGKGLYLHACLLEFLHPITSQTISITKDLPSKFKKIFLSI
jgi:23S rRNA pseudouridine1911/1915/1917 synthase